MKRKSKMQRKVATVMREYSRGSLKSGSGRGETSRKQAVAIALSEGRRAAHKKQRRRQ